MNLQTIIKSHYLAAIFLVAFITASIYLTLDNESILYTAINKEQKTDEQQRTIARNDSFSICNLFSGRWVFDNKSYPLYNERQCSFLLNQSFTCEKYGRKDTKYQNWRWQPHGCDIPRFNGTTLLEKIRGKRLLFVGDSVNRNQWISMLCLIEPFLHQSTAKLVINKGNSFTFLATGYNATIGFYWSPFLVESNCDDPVNHLMRERIIKIKAIEEHARHWSDADILIFDSFAWWTQQTMTLLWGSFGSSDAIYKKVNMKLRRYEMGLNTWSDWLEININRTKTKLFFMSLSPLHFGDERWGVEQNCYNQTEPISEEGYWVEASTREMMRIAESIIHNLEKRGVKVKYLNITHLSEYRKDAHPSIYTKFANKVREKQLANLKSYSDCLHWCLPGVPDVWNQILYSYIINYS
ncbi:protein trichome birefringence-like 34 [Phtheirospermum japonicum]|uniref:Protein trichome birefringence-like 34 n=1 Tax=Phtheirospermum japonicum TaxID=374723 RepID=A0A830BXC8_9LAMI|nr:protein trichome birefringence-like 34 [Phtheirospermum japonicum]